MFVTKDIRKQMSKLTRSLSEHQKAITRIRFEIEDLQKNCPHDQTEIVEDIEQKYAFKSCIDCGKVFR